jgi:hypothetical protein
VLAVAAAWLISAAIHILAVAAAVVVAFGVGVVVGRAS